jgi:hypothetical protein
MTMSINTNTTVTSVYYDSNGNIINIGPWVYNFSADPNGNVYPINLVPEGTTVEQKTVVTNQDGSISVIS